MRECSPPTQTHTRDSEADTSAHTSTAHRMDSKTAADHDRWRIAATVRPPPLPIHGGVRCRGLHRRRRAPHGTGTRPCARPHHAGARVCARPVLPPRPRMEERRMTLTIYNAADIPQGSDAWLEARRGIVTASTVGKLLTSTGKIANNDTSRTLIDTLANKHITDR